MSPLSLRSLRQQPEKEKMSATPEVSNCTITPNNMPERLSEISAINSLRRRRPIAIPDSNDSGNSGQQPLLLDTLDPCIGLAKCTANKSSKPKYPNIPMTYPRILSSNKIHPDNIPKPKKVPLTKPPSARPPLFLKCNLKKKSLSRETTDEELEDADYAQNHRPTDLDIQLRRLKLEACMSSSSSDSGKRMSVTSDQSGGQSMSQYCNFEEQKIIKVAPHIRRKDVICDTVDAWSREKDGRVTAGKPRYKPLIFGGTFPIDAPFRDRILKDTSQLGAKTPSGRFISKTFDIDAPTGF